MSWLSGAVPGNLHLISFDRPISSQTNCSPYSASWPVSQDGTYIHCFPRTAGNAHISKWCPWVPFLLVVRWAGWGAHPKGPFYFNFLTSQAFLKPFLKPSVMWGPHYSITFHPEMGKFLHQPVLLPTGILPRPFISQWFMHPWVALTSSPRRSSHHHTHHIVTSMPVDLYINKILREPYVFCRRHYSPLSQVPYGHLFWGTCF